MAYKTMKTLINAKRGTREDMLNKCDVFFAMGRITESQYKELIELIDENYPVKEETEEPTEE